MAWLKTLPAPVRVVYEAGPTGYGLARACAEAGISCVVAAPSKIRPAADRVKTDRRDAERLARLLRLGEITAVRVPGPEEEAARDLVRAREDARGDLMRARHRLSKLLLRHGAVYDATAWTRAHDAWLRKQRFQSGPLAIVFDECYGRMIDAKTRRDALDKAITELAATPPYRRCRRAARLSPRRLDADGVRADRRARRLEQVPARVARPVPRPHPERELKRASGAGKARSPRPATAHARRLLIEAAWHQRSPSRLSVTLERRRTGKSLAVRAQADRSARRLHGRWHALEARGKPRTIVVVAVAASSPDTAGRSRRWSSRHRSTARRGERTGETTRGATRENTVSSPIGGHARRQRTAPLLISHTRSCGTNPRI